MSKEDEDEVPDSGAVFTFGKSKFADNIPSKFWLKNDVPLKVSCGDEHTALITENGKLFMFGSNNWGQLGLGSKVTVNKPTFVKALKSEKVSLVACGRNHTLISTAHGNVYATGGNNEGQLGLGDCEERTSFQRINFFDSCGPVAMLAAGSNTSAALTERGKLYMWGDNGEGQLGLGKESQVSVPHEVSVGQSIRWVSCGYYHSAFVTVEGALYTFGERDSGKLGLGTDQLSGHKVPQIVKGITDPVTQVACGGGHTVALTEDGIYSFGLGQFGQLGHGTFIFESRMPRQIDHFRKGRVQQVACGENHTAVVTDGGLLYTFGDGRHGKLGLGEENFTNQFKPTLCSRFLQYQIAQAVCGGCHMVVLACPRDPDSCVTLEDDDVAEDVLERPYVELLDGTSKSSTLQRSISARVRRRERERSPDQFGPMFRSLQNTDSSSLLQPIPSSRTRPQPKSRKTLNAITHSLPKEDIETLTDSESVKDFGETSDFLNMTHVMKLDPADKSLSLSPVHKGYAGLPSDGSKNEDRTEDDCEDEDVDNDEDDEDDDDDDDVEDTNSDGEKKDEKEEEKSGETTSVDERKEENLSDKNTEEQQHDTGTNGDTNINATTVETNDGSRIQHGSKKMSFFRRLSRSKQSNGPELNHTSTAEQTEPAPTDSATSSYIRSETGDEQAIKPPTTGVRPSHTRSGACSLL